MANNTTGLSISPPCVSTGGVATHAVLKALLYVCVFLFSLTGNSILISAVWKKPHLKTALNLFILNMAVADLSVTIVNMLVQISHYCRKAVGEKYTWFGGWAGNATCKLVSFAQGVSIACSVLTLTSIAGNRFLAVMYPFSCGASREMSKYLIAVIWLLSFLLISPMFYATSVKSVEGFLYCVEEWSPLFDNKTASEQYTLVLFGLLYAFPLVLISVLYSCVVYKVWVRQVPGNVTAPNQQLELQTKKRVLKMLITVVVVFTLCWLPYYVYLLLHFIEVQQTGYICDSSFDMQFFGLFLGHTNSAINPLIYTINKDYRREFKNIFQVLCRPCRLANSRVGTSQGTLIDPNAQTLEEINPSALECPEETRQADKGTQQEIAVEKDGCAKAI